MSQNPEPIQISKSGHSTFYQPLLPFLYDIVTKKNTNMEQNGFSQPLMHRGRKSRLNDKHAFHSGLWYLNRSVDLYGNGWHDNRHYKNDNSTLFSGMVFFEFYKVPGASPTKISCSVYITCHNLA